MTEPFAISLAFWLAYFCVGFAVLFVSEFGGDLWRWLVGVNP